MTSGTYQRHGKTSERTSNVQRRQEVDGDVIDWSLVVEEYPGCVHVVTLGCHVQGGQAVLGAQEEYIEGRQVVLGI